MWKGIIHSILLLLLPALGFAQPQGMLIDRIIAVVGREAILHSELTARLAQAQQAGAPMGR